MTVDIVKMDEVIRKILRKYVHENVYKNGTIVWTKWATPWFREQMDKCSLNDMYNREKLYDHDFYVLETGRILYEYIQSLKIPLKIIFGKKVHQPPEQLECIYKYQLCISRLYISNNPPQRLDNVVYINDFKINTESASCTTCGQSNLLLEGDTESLFTCTFCGTKKDVYQHAINYNDSRRINLSQKNPNDKRNHFINCFNQYQGLARSIVTQDIFNQIEAELMRYGLVNTSETTRAKQYSRVTREHIRLILKDLKLFKTWGDNLTYIYNTITENYHNIEHLKEKVLQDFDTFNELYNKRYPNPDKKPFNYQQLLFQFLERHGHSCNPNDFNFLKTTERKQQHDQMYRVLFQELGWNYISFF